MVISSVLITIGAAVMNAVAFSDTNILFSNLMKRTQKTSFGAWKTTKG